MTPVGPKTDRRIHHDVLEELASDPYVGETDVGVEVDRTDDERAQAMRRDLRLFGLLILKIVFFLGLFVFLIGALLLR